MIKNISRKSIFVFILVVLCVGNIGCSKKGLKSESNVNKVIEMACMPSGEDLMGWIVEGLEPKGYDVKVSMFEGNQLPVTALKDGDVDAVIGNQLPWLNTFNKENNCDLKMVEPYLYHGFKAIYSSKYKLVDEIGDNAQIAIPGDPSNMNQSLLILEGAGLITLGEKSGDFYSILDIKDNPKNIKLIETERSTTMRSINDVDAVITDGSQAYRAGFDPNDYLFQDPNGKDYPHGLIVGPDDTEKQWVKDLLEYFETQEFKEKFNNYYKGSQILYNN